MERAEGVLPQRSQPLGPGGLHRALQRGVPRGEVRAPRRQGGRAVRRAQQPGRRAAERVGPARAVGGDRLARARRRRPLARAQGRRRLRGRRRQHQDPRGHPAGERGRGRPEVRRRRPVAAGPHGPADLVGRVLPGRARRRRSRPAEPGDRRRHAGGGGRVRGDGRGAALLWGPQADDIAYAALWTDSTEPGGGRPTR